MGKRFQLTAPTIAEHPRHKAVADTLTIEIAPPGRVSVAGVLWFSIDIADYGGSVPGTRIGRGIIAGVPDVFVLWRGLAHHIELKTEVGVLEEAQRAVIAAILGAGGRAGVARDSADVLRCLDTWGIPRHRRTRFAA